MSQMLHGPQTDLAEANRIASDRRIGAVRRLDEVAGAARVARRSGSVCHSTLCLVLVPRTVVALDCGLGAIATYCGSFAMRILSTLGRRYLDLCRTVRNQEPWSSVSPSLTCTAGANRSDWPAENFSEFLANSLRRLASSHLLRLRRRGGYVPGQHPDLPTIALTNINR